MILSMNNPYSTVSSPTVTEMFPTTMEKYTNPTEKDDFETTTMIAETTEDFFGFGSEEDFQSDENCPTSCTE